MHASWIIHASLYALLKVLVNLKLVPNYLLLWVNFLLLKLWSFPTDGSPTRKWDFLGHVWHSYLVVEGAKFSRIWRTTLVYLERGRACRIFALGRCPNYSSPLSKQPTVARLDSGVRWSNPLGGRPSSSPGGVVGMAEQDPFQEWV